LNTYRIYHRQNIDYADYFQAAWRYKHRAALGKPNALLADCAAEGKISPKYLSTIWTTLEGKKADVGPLVKLQALWSALPASATSQPEAARQGCEAMRAYVLQLRKKVECRFYNIQAGRVGAGSVPMMIRKNVAYASHRMSYEPAQLQVEGEEPPPPYQGPEPGATGDLGPGPTQPSRTSRVIPTCSCPRASAPAMKQPSPRFAGFSPTSSTWRSAAGITTIPPRTAPAI
jgi:hypothetical protein